MSQDEIMSISEACEHLGISRTTLLRRIEQGMIEPLPKPPALKRHRHLEFLRSNVEWLSVRQEQFCGYVIYVCAYMETVNSGDYDVGFMSGLAQEYDANGELQPSPVPPTATVQVIGEEYLVQWKHKPNSPQVSVEDFEKEAKIQVREYRAKKTKEFE